MSTDSVWLGRVGAVVTGIAVLGGVSYQGSPANAVIGVLAMLAAYFPEKPSLAQKFLIMLALSFLVDMIWLGLWTKYIEDLPDAPKDLAKHKHTQRFMIGVTVVCLLLKPVLGWFGYKVFTGSRHEQTDYVEQSAGQPPYAGVSYQNDV